MPAGIRLKKCHNDGWSGLNPVLLIVLFLKSVLPGQTFFIKTVPHNNSAGRFYIMPVYKVGKLCKKSYVCSEGASYKACNSRKCGV